MVVDPTSNTYPCVPDQSINCPDIFNSLQAYYQIQNTSTVLNLLLKQGVYTGVNNTNLIFGNSSVTIGANGNDKVTIDLQSNGNFISIPPLKNTVVSELTLQNINIVNGNSTTGGVLFLNTSTSFADIRINNVTFSNNMATNGGVFYIENNGNGGYILVSQSTFISNTASGEGSIFYSQTNSYISFSNCLLQNNYQTSMIYAVNPGFSLINSTIDSNIGNNSLVNLAYNDPCTITNNIFTNNSLMTSGAIIKSYSNRPRISNSLMANNTADAIIRFQSVQFYSMNVINTTFDSNKLIYGALFINPRSTIQVNNSTFSRNVGGAIYFNNDIYPDTTESIISTSKFINNIAVNSSATDIFAKNITLYLNNVYFQSALPTSNASAPIFCDTSIMYFNGITSNIKDNMFMNCRSTTCKITGASANICPNGGNIPSKKNNNGLSSGAIAGIIIGVIAGILLVGLLIYIAYKRHHNRHKYLSYN